jgi:hypothetical protein
VDLEQLLAQQGGVVTRAQAIGAGLSERQLRGADRSLVRLRQGVFGRAGLAGPERTAAEVAAARLVSRVELVAVGSTAAVLHGLPVLGPVTRGLRLAECKQQRPQHHGGSRTVHPDEVVQQLGVPATSPARTAVDLARARGLLAGVLAADAVLARGVGREELEAAVLRCAGWPGARAAAAAVAFADGRSESPLESLGRVRCHEQGLPAPELQVWLADAHGSRARVDQYWADHRTVAEADGALKYATASDLYDEKRREDRLRDAGYEVVRYTWDEALRHPQQLRARVLRAFERAARRVAA